MIRLTCFFFVRYLTICHGHEHPGPHTSIPQVFMNIPGMFVFRWGCSCKLESLRDV